MKDKLKDFFIKDKFYAVLLAGIIINILCFCIFSCNPLVVHAAGTGQLPYVVPANRDLNTFISEREINICYQQAITSFPAMADSPYICWTVEGYYNNRYKRVWFGFNPVINNVYTDAFDYSTTPIRVNFSGVQPILAVVYDVQNGTTSTAFNIGNRTDLFGSQTTTTTSAGTFTSMYPFYLSGMNNIYDSTGEFVVISNTAPVVIPDGGDPTAPDDTFINNLDSNVFPSTAPTVPGSYTPTFSSAPTWDSTQPVQSVFNYLIWGFDVLKDLIKGALDKLVEWISYIASLLGFLVKKILEFIQSVVNWLFQQFLNWLTPYLKIWSFISGLLFNEDEQKSVFDLILDFLGLTVQWLAQFWQNSFIVDYWDSLQVYIDDIKDEIDNVVTAIDNLRIAFTTDSNPSLIVQGFGSTYLGRLVNAFKTLGTGLVGIFTDITAPDVLSFTIDFSTAPAPFNDIGIFSFNFGWYNNIRNIVVPIIVTCVYVGFGYNLFFKAPGIISGLPGGPLVTFDTQPVPTLEPPYPGQRRIGTRGFTLK